MASFNTRVRVVEDNQTFHVFEPTRRVHFLTDPAGAFIIEKLKENNYPTSLYTDTSRLFGLGPGDVDKYLNQFMAYGLFQPPRENPVFHDDYIKGYRELPAGYAFPPNVFYWVITWACNLRCAMCPLWSPQASRHTTDAQISEPALSLGDARRVLSRLARAGTRIIHITGGEPLLYDHLVESIRHIRETGMMATVFSNGTLIDETRARELIGTGIEKIGVSLDGTETVHDQIRGRGNFSRAISGLTHLLKARRDAKGQTRIYFMNTVTRRNYYQLPDLLKLAAEVGADGMFVAHPAFTGADAPDRQGQILSSCFFPSLDGPSWQVGQSLIADEVSEIPVERLFDIIDTLHGMAGKLGLEFSPNLAMSKEELNRYYNSDRDSVIDRCLWPWQGGFVDPCGRVYPCVKIRAGDLKEDDFFELWNSEIYRRFRRLIKAKGLIPCCERCCQLINEQTRYDLTRLGV